MPQSLSNIILHITFSTKDRVRAIVYPDLRSKLEAYMVGILRNLECPSLATRVVTDHAHVLFCLSRTQSVSRVVQVVKQETSSWIKQQAPPTGDPYLAKFAWQKGYAVFSVSESAVSKAKAYVESQEAHHKRVTFQDEYRAFLKKHGVTFDERYVWD